MQNATSEGWLVIVFGRVLGIGFAPKSVDDAFRVGDIVYQCSDPDFLTAFVDRLVDSEDHVVGFYVSAVSKSGHDLVAGVPPRPYLRAEEGALEVWVSEAPLTEVRNTGEQAFGGRVFHGSDSTMAMTIDMSGLLTAHDVECLSLANADHVVIDA